MRHIGEICIYILVILLLSTGAYLRNQVWKSDAGLWADCVMKSPGKARPYNNLGRAVADQGRYREAIPYLTRAPAS